MVGGEFSRRDNKCCKRNSNSGLRKQFLYSFTCRKDKDSDTKLVILMGYGMAE